MTSSLGLGKLGKHINLPTLGVRDFWRQPESSTAAPAILLPQPVVEEEAPLSPRSVQVRDEAKQAALEVRSCQVSQFSTRRVSRDQEARSKLYNSTKLKFRLLQTLKKPEPGTSSIPMVLGS